MRAAEQAYLPSHDTRRCSAFAAIFAANGEILANTKSKNNMRSVLSAALPLVAIGAPYVIDFLPAPSPSGFRNESLWSWGGSIVMMKGSPSYHLFASAFVGGCNLNSWGSNSVAIHAVASSPLGPFSFVERALPFYHHNVEPIIAPDGTLLIFSIGMAPDPAPSNCSAASGISSSHGFESIEIWSSKNGVDGPWIPLSAGPPNGLNIFNGTNPSPAFDPSLNGTIYVMSHTNANFTVAMAPSWKGPWHDVVAVPVFTTNIGDYVGEDPFLWWDGKIPNALGGVGAWRVLYHAYNKSDTRHQVNVGGYAQSAGADIFGPWHVQDPSTSPAYTTSIEEYVSGSSGPTTTTVFSRRERPKLWFDPKTGEPAALFTGVCPLDSSDCFTSVVPISCCSQPTQN